MTNTQPVTCVPCQGSGEKFNNFADKYDVCRNCGGNGEVIPCNSFATRKPSAMRNRSCDNCNATENQHNMKSVQTEKINA
jgi:DnaJ-class molecular chaperone